MATIVYTSGTTGNPKGVMLDIHAFSYAMSHALDAVNLNSSSRFFSYLPLSHIAERFLVEMGSLYSGGSVAYTESLEKFAENLREAKPTVFLGVPRIWTKFQQGILTKLPQKKLNLLLSIPIISSLIKKKIKTGLGLQNATDTLTGAAPTPVALMKWFSKLGINIQEAYAMTENCCYSHVTLNNDVRWGYVGKPFPHVDVKISEEGEILIKHKALMKGYYKEPEITAETFADGYLKTGDKGEVNADGFLKITGRVKDLFKTDKGKYVAPSPIELKFAANTLVEQVCVVGTTLPQPIAMAILSEGGHKKSKQELTDNLSETLATINSTLESHERLSKIVILDKPWTVENELLTPTLKVKRNEIEKIYQPKYDAWYNKEGSVIWN